MIRSQGATRALPRCGGAEWGMPGGLWGVPPDPPGLLQPLGEQAHGDCIEAVTEGLLGSLQDVCRVLCTPPGADKAVAI